MSLIKNIHRVLRSAHLVFFPILLRGLLNFEARNQFIKITVLVFLQCGELRDASPTPCVS